MMETVLLDVTPADARALLAKNLIDNRKLRSAWVDDLAAAIQRGEWRLTHQGIALDADGNLLDGQHRLNAIAKSGITCKMLVTFGCDPDSFVAMDLGNRRSVADNLHVSNAAAALAVLLHRLLTPSVKGTRAVTPLEVAAILEWCRDPLDLLLTSVPTTRRGRTSASVRLGVLLRIMHGEAAHALPQYRALVALDYDNLGSAPRSFLRQITDGKYGGGGWELAARSWRAFAKDNLASRVLVKDITVPLAEMRDVARKYCGEHQQPVLAAEAA